MLVDMTASGGAMMAGYEAGVQRQLTRAMCFISCKEEWKFRRNIPFNEAPRARLHKEPGVSAEALRRCATPGLYITMIEHCKCGTTTICPNSDCFSPKGMFHRRGCCAFSKVPGIRPEKMIVDGDPSDSLYKS